MCMVLCLIYLLIFVPQDTQLNATPIVDTQQILAEHHFSVESLHYVFFVKKQCL